MGAVPDWYATIRAAKYLGVAPWELTEREIVWQDWALIAESAEEGARQTLRENAAQKRRQGGGVSTSFFG